MALARELTMEPLQLTSIICVIASFILIPIFYSKEDKVDYLGFTIVAALISVGLTMWGFGSTSAEVVEYVKYEPLVYIISMNIIVLFLEKENIFQVLAIKGIQWTKSNPRLFLYLTSLLSVFISAIMEDVSVVLMFIPLIVRTCHILKIKPHAYIYSIAICINMGNLVLPFSNSQNILITTEFNLSTAWFLKSFFPAVIFVSILTIIIIDRTMVRNQPTPTEDQKKLINELLKPAMLIKNNNKFWGNVIGFFLIIVALLVFPAPFIVTCFGAVGLALINRQHIGDTLEKLDWKIILFLICLFLITGCMILNGTIDFIGGFLNLIMTDNPLVDALIILIAVSLIGSLISNNPATLLFIPLFREIFVHSPYIGTHGDLLFIAFILGLNLGANLLPEGAPTYLMTINLAQKYNIENLNFNTMRKIGMRFAIIHIGMCSVYLVIYYLFMMV